MKIPGIEITFDSDQVCRYMPAAVAVASGLIYIISYLFDITMAYTLFFMLLVGFGASLYLSSGAENTRDVVVPLDQPDESVFEDTDPSEAMLLDLEAITLLINELSAKQIESSRVQTEDAVTAIIDRFVHISDDLSTFSKEHNLDQNESMRRIHVSLSDILVSFQFQDRTSQILHHVSSSLEMFSDEIKSIQELREKGGEPEYDRDDVIKKLTAGFTTAEQKAMVSNNPQSESGNNVEFF